MTDLHKKRLITSALPYVNNIPHLGNLIQVLSADVFARFCRSRGYETLYICGTDEYGTATETKAKEEGITPKELCDRYYKIHNNIYNWFQISFDIFGRTSTKEHTDIVQHIFKEIRDAGYIEEKEIKQLYSEKSQMFLADRYVTGTCPKCKYEFARGDQCESCGTLLDSLELIHPQSNIDNTRPIVKDTKHLYINLPKLLPKLEQWVVNSKQKGTWSKNAIKMTDAWIRDGLTERAITRDLKWGIPVPHEGYENKVFYVWFDAPIGYISITATLTKDWKTWWQNHDKVNLYHFIGKDNIPFHTVVFPSTLLGTGENWTMLHQISSSEYLNYDGGMFSKSKGIGVFGNDVMDTGIPADAWRFYLFYNRPESSDYLFTWKDFQEAVNGELVNNLSNLYNRTLAFVCKYFDAKVVNIDMSEEETRKIWAPVLEFEQEITNLLEKVELRQSYLKIFALSSYANKLLQDYEPWKLRVENPEKAHRVLSNLIYMIREISVLIEPYTPGMAQRITSSLNIPQITWQELQFCAPRDMLNEIKTIQTPEHLFTRLDDSTIVNFKERFSGSQSDRTQKDLKSYENKVSQFAKTVCLKVCKILEVTLHPDADKLYVLRLDDGTEEGRTIVSGIKDHYTIEEILGKQIIVVANLKPAKLRGILSNGMLLAASAKDFQDSEKEIVEVLFLDEAPVGSLVLPQGESAPQEYQTIKAEKFFEIKMKSNSEGKIEVENTQLVVLNRDIVIPVVSKKVSNAPVG